jgi:hypothetical protein
MAFPSSPANGQRATVNNIIYEYNDTKGAWLRVSAQGFTSANLTVGGLITDNYYRADGTSLLGVNKSVYNGTATAGTSATLIDSVPTAGNTSVAWSLTSKDTDNSTYKNSVVSSLNDGTNVYYSEYGIILSNASVSVSTFTSNIVSGNLRLYAVGDSANVAITFQRTLLGSSTDVGYLTAGARGAQGPEGNVNVSYGNTDVATYLTTYTGNIGNVKTTANVVTTGYFIGNASQLTGLPVSYGNTEVATYLTTYTGNLSAGATTISGNLTVGGNLIVNGNVTYINANNINLNDSLIYLADDNPADTLDIGLVSAFTDATRYQHTGLVRDATDGVWKLFANVVAEPTTTVDFTGANYANLLIGNLIANNITATSTDLTLGAISIGNINLATLGGLQFKAIDATGSVNVWNVRGGDGSTTSPRFTTEGTGTNIAGQFNTKGTGALQFYSGNTEQMRIINTASAVNYVQVTGAATGQQPSISAQGSDAGVILQLAAKGGSAISFVTNGVNSALQFQVLHTGSSVNYYQATGGAAGQPPRLISAGSDTNIDLTLTSKGSGNITTANSVIISNSSASTSTTTGALIVTGGVGVSGNLNVSGEINTSKTVTALNILNPFLLAGM